MLVYRPDGTSVEKDPVDARECVSHCGFTFEPPEKQDKQPETVIGLQSEKVIQITDNTESKDFDAMTSNELKSYLDSKGVKFHHLAGHNKLVQLAKEVE